MFTKNVLFALCISSITSVCYGDSLVSGPTQVTGDSPFSETLLKSSCFAQQPVVGTLYRSSESEPDLAVNPANPMNMIITYHQDRFARFGGAATNGAHYTMDGGATWIPVSPGSIPFTRCASALGGNPGSYKPFERATDPWIIYNASGTAYFQALVFDQDYLTGMPSGAVVLSKSTDGGVNWGDINTIVQFNGKGYGVPLADKNTLTIDQHGKLYSVFQIFKLQKGSTFLNTSTDGGVKWSPTKQIYNPKNDRIPQGDKKGYSETGFAEIVALSDGTLVNAMTQAFDSENARIGVIRSTNGGRNWDQNMTKIADISYAVLNDPDGTDQNGEAIPIRGAGQNVSIAINKSNDKIYVAWSDLDSNSGKYSAYVSMSSNKGLTWSTPKKVNQVTTVDAFIPIVNVAANGVVGVFYYDLRNDVTNDSALSTDAHLATFDGSLNFRDETRLTPTSFDLRKAPLLNGGGGSLIPGGYFLGDYFGLDTVGNDFVVAFIQTTGEGTSGITPDPDNFVVDPYNRQDVYFARVTTTLP